MTLDISHWQRRLDTLASEQGIPGAALGVLADGEIATAVTGVVNVETGVETTPEAIFSIGSITKLVTSLAALRLVDAGRLELDAPVRATLPEFRVADPRTTAEVTLRHLLSHASGIAGDEFTDTGRGDEALERYVAHCAELGQDVPLGATMSYSNTGFSIVGRMIEQVTGTVWDAAMRTLVYEPLGLRHTVTLPEDALRFRVAWGHLPRPDGSPAPVDSWDFPRSSGPAGSISSSPADLLAVARLFLDDGRGPDGAPVLSPELTREMTRAQIDVPDRAVADHWGLGWSLCTVDGRAVLAHGGNGSGQNALLQVVPDSGVAVTVLSNGGDQTEAPATLCAELLRELCGIEPPPKAQPLPDPASAAPESIGGSYERFGFRLDVTPDGPTPRGVLSIAEPLASQLPDFPPRELRLHPSDAGENVYVAHVEPGREDWTPLVFIVLGDDRYVHFGGRAMRKVA